MRVSICLLLVVLASGPAFARILVPDAVEGLEAAVDQRMLDLSGLLSPTAGELKEKAGLVKARGLLGSWSGTTDKAGLSALAKALAATAKAGGDPDVAAACGVLKSSLLAEGVARQGLAQAARDLLLGDAAKAKMDAAIAKAAALFTPAADEPDFGAAAKLIAKAVLSLDKVRVSVGKYLEKELADRDPYVTAEWPGVVFSAPPGGSYATWFAEGALQIIGEQTSEQGDPHYILAASALDVSAPGEYPHPANWAALRRYTGVVKDDQWQSLDGSMLLLVLTKKVAAGTFHFTAESPSSGVVAVTNGTFLVPFRP
jgi:hypothetical protein